MKIIGWTDWDNQEYEEMFPLGGKHTWRDKEEVERIIAEELRSKGYKFTGDYHQNGDHGAPVFDNGKIYKGFQREWASIMADAYPDEIDNSDGFGYCCKWAWIPPVDEEMVVPDKDLL